MVSNQRAQSRSTLELRGLLTVGVRCSKRGDENRWQTVHDGDARDRQRRPFQLRCKAAGHGKLLSWRREREQPRVVVVQQRSHLNKRAAVGQRVTLCSGGQRADFLRGGRCARCRGCCRGGWSAEPARDTAVDDHVALVRWGCAESEKISPVDALWVNVVARERHSGRE